MEMIIVGAGEVGQALVRSSAERGHDVTLIEPDEERARAASKDVDIRVLVADIGTASILEEAGANTADALVATTGDDAANLLAMFLGSESSIERLVTVVNEVSHRPLFDRLGVQILEEPRQILARHLLDLIQQPSLDEIVELGDETRVSRFTIGERSELRDVTIAEADERQLFPQPSLVVTIAHGDEPPRIPGRAIRMTVGDRLALLTHGPLTEEELERIVGSADGPR